MTTKTASSPVWLQRFNGKEGRRFARFLVVGAIGFVLDFGIFNLAHALGFGVWVAGAIVPALLPHPEIIEQTLSLSIAICSNFLWNYFWIYPEARHTSQGGKMVKFLIVSIAGLVVGVPVFSGALLLWHAVVTALHLDSVGLNLAGNLALMTRVAILLFWNFFVNRFWTYRDVK